MVLRKTPIVTYLAFGVGSRLCTDLSNLSGVKWLQIRCGVFFLVSGGISTFFIRRSSDLDLNYGFFYWSSQWQYRPLLLICPLLEIKANSFSDKNIHSLKCVSSRMLLPNQSRWAMLALTANYVFVPCAFGKGEETRMLEEPILHMPNFLIAQRWYIPVAIKVDYKAKQEE